MIRRFLLWCWAKRWRRWTLIALPPLFLIGNIGMVEATSQSGFCKSCHIMEPYYASWKHGAHREIECVKCHISPGVDNFVAAKLNGLGQVVDDVLHRTGKPSASVGQLACTRSGCHTVENLKNRKIDTGKFKFDHAKHLDHEVMGIRIDCGTCHAHIKGGAEAQHFEVNTDACITCHMLTRYRNGGPPLPTMRSEVEPIYMTVREPQGKGPVAPSALLGAEIGGTAAPAPADKSPDWKPPAGKNGESAAAAPLAGKTPPINCTACHNPPSEPFEYQGMTVDHTQFLSYGAACESCHRNVTAKPEPIDDAKCLACHTFGIEKTLPREELHKVHAEGAHKVECFSCHGVTRHGKDAQAISVGQFECKACHKDQHAIQQQTYLLRGITPHSDTPMSPMFLAHVDCTGCHIKQESLSVKPKSGATVAKAVPEACDRCHQPGFGAKMVPRWQGDTHALYDQIETQLKELKPSPDGTLKGAAAEARALLDMVRNDSSWGVHNPRYTQQILERAREKVREAREGESGTAPVPPPNPPSEQPSPPTPPTP
jgi:nitrate/TMAO reductase-like tetraheme cytochrome c subunit